MITKILRLIECIPPDTRISRPRLSAKAASTPLILRLKNLILKTCAIPPQNRLQPIFVKQAEFVFCELGQRNHLPR
jgi:hypothetical protein